MKKDIDPVDVKQAIKNGQLEVFARYSQFNNDFMVYLKDRDTEETVLLTTFKGELVKSLFKSGAKDGCRTVG